MHFIIRLNYILGFVNIFVFKNDNLNIKVRLVSPSRTIFDSTIASSNWEEDKTYFRWSGSAEGEVHTGNNFLF